MPWQILRFSGNEAGVSTHVMTYDIKIEGGRPPNSAINGFSTPREDAEIQIRLWQ